MKKLQKLLTLGLAAAGAAVLLTGCGKKALEDSDLEAASWDQITEAARDTTVTFYGWGGDENRNNWLNTGRSCKRKLWHHPGGGGHGYQ